MDLDYNIRHLSLSKKYFNTLLRLNSDKIIAREKLEIKLFPIRLASVSEKIR